MIINLFSIRKLNDMAEVHNGNSVRNMTYNQKVVSYKEIRKPELFLKLVKHIDNLSLNRNVKRGYRLVAHDEIGVNGKRTRNAYTLALTARKFVGITGSVLTVEPDVIHKLKDFLFPFLFVAVKLMNVKRFADDIGYRHSRVKR